MKGGKKNLKVELRKSKAEKKHHNDESNSIKCKMSQKMQCSLVDACNQEYTANSGIYDQKEGNVLAWKNRMGRWRRGLLCRLRMFPNHRGDGLYKASDWKSQFG